MGVLLDFFAAAGDAAALASDPAATDAVTLTNLDPVTAGGALIRSVLGPEVVDLPGELSAAGEGSLWVFPDRLAVALAASDAESRERFARSWHELSGVDRSALEGVLEELAEALVAVGPDARLYARLGL